MSTVAEIREAIRKLAAKDAWQLARELREHLDDLWEKEFEEAVKADRLDSVIARARREYFRGKN
jgi:Arc/MetJ-type ribon-helix-helix transcriptional regulator